MSNIVSRVRVTALSTAAGALLVSASACASAPRSSGGMVASPGQATAQNAPALPAMPVPTQAPVLSAPLPPLAVGQTAVAASPSQVITHMNLPKGTELGNAVKMLASQFGMGAQIDAGASAPVNVTLQGLTLRQALDRIVTQQGYSYTIQDSVIVITAARMETKFIPFGYVTGMRTATATTTIARRLSGGGSGIVAGGTGQTQGATTTAAGGGNVGFAGGDAIVATTVADLWQEITVGLNAIVFQVDPNERVAGSDSAAVSAPATSSPSNANSGNFQSQVFQHVEGGKKLIINPMAGTITVTALPGRMREVEAYLATIEASVIRQVMIEARFVEVGFTHDRKFGIDWSVILNRGNTGINAGTPGAGSSGLVEFTLTGGTAQITAVLEALESQGTVQEVGRPTVTAINNQPAVMNVVTDEVFFTTTRQPTIAPTGGTVGFTTQVSSQTIPVGIVLNVVPQISADNVTMMLIRPMLTTVSRVATFELEDGTKTSQPVVDRKEADTMARLRDGETIIIGGLTKSRVTRDRSGIPILMNIPGLGRLFTHYEDVDRRSELVIFLTPHIMAGNPIAPK